MSLNIKNEHVHALAREAARLTGMSQTSAIELALTRFLREAGADPADAHRAAKLERLAAIGERFRAQERPARGVSRIEDLYDDETGLPR